MSIEMPLLIPSFSSKGFQFQTNGTSEVGKILEATAEFITESYLVSAYDILHKHIPPPNEIEYRPNVIVLDSGGYEVSKDRDMSDVTEPAPGRKLWDADMHRSVLDAWPAELATIFVSYDHPDERHSFGEQVTRARELFKNYRDHLNTFLIKPESNGQRTTQSVLKKAIAEIEDLRSFDIIGLTQKELGHSLLEQMCQIARLRKALDTADLKAPIHIFGSLDPLTVCLFFIAGAEIFDGLTWIRYAYRDGQCVYIDNAAVFKNELHLGHDLVKGISMRDNIVTLGKLALQIRDFQHSGDFSKLPHHEIIRSAYDSLQTRLGKGGMN